MSDLHRPMAGQPWQQAQTVEAHSLRSTLTFVPFHKADIEQSITDRFEQQVVRYAQHLAVKTRDQQLTYDELNTAANRVAQAILARRGAREEPVALLFAPGTAAIVAMLGGLKAGKSYVPLDPAYPQVRIHYMLEDSQATLILTNDRHLRLAETLTSEGCEVLNLDTLDTDLPEGNPRLSLSPDTLAYILYTSGSTGQPKGVAESHRNLLHHIMRVTNALQVRADDRQTLLRSHSFNGAVRDIFSALLNGASLHVFNLAEEGMLPLATWMTAEGISIYRSVISVFRQFMNTLSPGYQIPKLRLVHVGGEPVYRRDVELFQQHFPRGCILVNGLGITEAGSARHYFIDHDTQIPGDRVPVGYPVEDVEILLLDDAGQPVQAGRVGEIAIRSRYLSPGYWRRPDLTRAKYLPDPQGSDARLYLTGDLGLMQADGCLEMLGRKDFQVKVRGHRIEVDEVERALREHPAVKDVTVVAHAEREDDVRLVAYVVPVRMMAPTTTELRAYVQQRLPDYMVPSAFAMLEALPLTVNGKVDRQALPAVPRTRSRLAIPFTLPRTPNEAELAKIWAAVLGLEEVGIHDHFLELGGHSLLATQIASRVRDAFRVEVPLSALFEAPTVAEMAVVITQHLTARLAPDELSSLLDEIGEAREPNSLQ
jgi:amino acid adenylation domain-containing protein